MRSIEKAADRLAKVFGDGPAPRPEQEPIQQKSPVEPQGRRVSREVELNLQSLSERGFLVPDKAGDKIAEEYRVIKRPLLINAFGKGAAPVDFGNLIMVTSALPGEGKTFTTLNLAMSIAMEQDTTVLLIDSDVISPSLSGLLGAKESPGLTDLLLDPTLDLSDVIAATNIPGLKVIPAGQPHPRSTELLSSEHMTRMTQELSERYPDRVVLFDAPPLLVTTQARVLAHLVGQILVVVESGRTPQDAVKEAVSQIDPEKVIGMVLNKSRRRTRGSYYGDYYGHYGQ